MPHQSPRPLLRANPGFRRRLLAVVNPQLDQPQFRVERQRPAFALPQGGGNLAGLIGELLQSDFQLAAP
jgi:hypothetical protein